MDEVENVEVYVALRHIGKGVRDDCEKCPIALALAELVNGETSLNVDSESVTFRRTNFVTQTYTLPAIAWRFIGDFDEWVHMPPSPISFILPIHKYFLKATY